LPFDCPADWQSRLTPRRGYEYRVTNAEFDAMREELARAVANFPTSLGPLKPGDGFQPVLLKVPSRPKADFLWPPIAVLVSERVRALCVDEGWTGVVFSRVEYECVGRRSPNAKLRSRGGEPEDMLRRIPAGRAMSEVCGYAHVTVTQKSGLPPGVDPASVCPECGGATLFKHPKRQLVFEESMWPGDDFCRLATTRYVIITDRVKRALERLEATNVEFQDAAEEVGVFVPKPGAISR